MANILCLGSQETDVFKRGRWRPFEQEHHDSDDMATNSPMIGSILLRPIVAKGDNNDK